MFDCAADYWNHHAKDIRTKQTDKTKRDIFTFKPPLLLYVYFIYGIEDEKSFKKIK